MVDEGHRVATELVSPAHGLSAGGIEFNLLIFSSSTSYQSSSTNPPPEVRAWHDTEGGVGVREGGEGVLGRGLLPVLHVHVVTPGLSMDWWEGGREGREQRLRHGVMIKEKKVEKSEREEGLGVVIKDKRAGPKAEGWEQGEKVVSKGYETAKRKAESTIRRIGVGLSDRPRRALPPAGPPPRQTCRSPS